MLELLVTIIRDVGFPVAVVAYLLYERHKFNHDIVRELATITNALIKVTSTMEKVAEKSKECLVLQQYLENIKDDKKK